jgi:hypothetical protein
VSGVLAVLVAVGVLAAMLGDRLGHRLGKKRVSLFTLRPRHSGLLATCVAGGCIALLLSPLALWSAGLFADPPEPLIVRVPAAVRTGFKAGSAPSLTPRPPLRHGEGETRAPERVTAAVATATQPAALTTPSPDPRLPQLQQQLASAQAQIQALQQALRQQPRTLTASGREATLIARRGELLCAAQIPGALSAAQAQRALRDVLAAVETAAHRRGAGTGLIVAQRQLTDVTNRLQSVGAFTLRIHAGRSSHPGETVAVQVALQPLPPGSLADLQEQDRLDKAGIAAAQGLEQALAQLPGQDGVKSLPDAAYVPWHAALKPADGSARWAWHSEPLAGGPLWLRLSVNPDHP